MISTNTVSNEGWEGTDPFDMTWDEGWVGSDQVRFYRVETSTAETERLSIQTAPIPNPNGAGNTIVGKLVWERE